MSEHSDDPADRNELDRSGLFDATWYLQMNADVRDAGLDPLSHFCSYGWRENRRPNLYFDPAQYLAKYPDVRDSGTNPLLHYLRHGDQEGRRPVWHFDPVWYRAAYELPPDTIALAHFLTRRNSGCFAPVPELYAVPHLPPYRDDPASGADPFMHYLDDMRHQRREPFPDLQIVAASGLLDPNFYLTNNADVHEAALDPAAHFCRDGWREARKPNIYFDIHWYLQTNPVVARRQINPVMHYILQGEMSGRRPAPYFDPVWYRAAYAIEPGQNTLAHYLSHRRSQKFSPSPMFDVAWYVEQHRDEMGLHRDPFAHYLQAGTFRDLDPSPAFNAKQYRKRHLGRPSRHFRQFMHPDRDNPLVHYLRSHYR